MARLTFVIVVIVAVIASMVTLLVYAREPNPLAAVVPTVATNLAQSGTSPQIIPLLFSNNLPKVHVEIGDLDTEVRLDSGAYDFGIALPPDDIDRAKVIVTGTRRWTDAKGNELLGRTFLVPKLRVGDLTVHNVSGTEMVFAEGNAPPDRDGMLGFAFLRNYTLVIDFSSAQVRVHRADSLRPPSECAKRRAPLLVSASGLSSVVSTEFGPLHLGWDTAAQATVVTPDSLKIAPSAYHPGEERTLRKVAVGTLDLGPLVVRTVDLKIPGLDGLFGYDFFQTHRVCFDIARRAVAVTQATSTRR